MPPKKRKSSRRSESLTSSDRFETRTVHESSRCAISALREPSAFRRLGGTYPPGLPADKAARLPPPPPRSSGPSPVSRGTMPCDSAHAFAALTVASPRFFGLQASKEVAFIFSNARSADSFRSSATTSFGFMSRICSFTSRDTHSLAWPRPWYPAGLAASAPNLDHFRRASTAFGIFTVVLVTLTVRSVLIFWPTSLVRCVVIVLMPLTSVAVSKLYVDRQGGVSQGSGAQGLGALACRKRQPKQRPPRGCQASVGRACAGLTEMEAHSRRPRHRRLPTPSSSRAWREA
mmetsp:Transcript_28396/g.90524  ORF Transcript_28396/g.90524 Transcript_28396/m.90524 type:complete len:289 (-) Transcript_28396:12-878(-)